MEPMDPPTRCYVDNKKNRKLGRVGLPVGSVPFSKKQEIRNHGNSTLHNINISSTNAEVQVTRVCSHGERLQRTQPVSYLEQWSETLPQPNQQLRLRHTFLEKRDKLDRGFLSDVQVPLQFAGSQSRLKYQIEIEKMAKENARILPEIDRRSPSLKKEKLEARSRHEEEGGKPTRMDEIGKLPLEILKNQRKEAVECKQTVEDWKALIQQEIMEQFRVMKEEQEHERLKLRDEWEELKTDRNKWEEWRNDWERQMNDLEYNIYDLQNRSRRQAKVVARLEDKQREIWLMTKRENDLVEEKLKRNVRKLLMERKVNSYEKAEIVGKLLKLKFEESEAVEAARECSTFELAISYLQQECQVCFEQCPISKMVAMLSCEHQCCKICAEEYFKMQIRNRSVLDILCPFCDPLSSADDDEVLNEYFARLDILLRDVVSVEVHDLFHQKLQDWTIEKLGNIKWCAQCKNGYGIDDENQERLVCPHCNFVICALCECKWEKQHNGISCAQYAEWKEANCPEFQAEGLEKHLAEYGISCPNCNFKYSLAKGGCMHFKCLQCKFEFCSGCGQPFRMGSKCKVSNYCEKLGLHAHHPRNCLFYLRDKEPDALQKLLDDSCVPYVTETAQNDKCLVNVQVETPSGLVDRHCGIEVEENYAGLCRLHYIEYLVETINRNGIDPIPMLDETELAQELRRNNKVVPDKAPQEMDVEYCARLRQLITEQIPLEDVCAPTQAYCSW